MFHVALMALLGLIVGATFTTICQLPPPIPLTADVEFEAIKVRAPVEVAEETESREEL